MSKITEIINFNPPRSLKKGLTSSFIEMAALETNSRNISTIKKREFKGGGAKFKNGDTIFARITPCLENGKTAKVSNLNEDEIAFGSTEFIVMSAKEPEFDEHFIYYLARLPEFRSYAQGRMEGTSGRQRVSWQSLSEFEINFPAKETRKKIGDTLNRLDKKIELNTKTNETLEKLAQAIFKSWFVDFDPVKAKAKLKKEGGDLDSIAKELGMSKEILELFPDEFEESELGLIPKGWSKKEIRDIAKTIKGKSYKSTELSTSNTALVTLKSFKRGGGYRLDGLKEYTGAYKEEQEVFAGDLVIAYTDVTQAADVIGKPAMVISDKKYSHLVISLDVAVVRPESDLLKYYLYGLAMTDKFQSHTKSHSTGTTVLHLSKNAVPGYIFCQPSNQLLKKYDSMVSPLFKLINENIESNKDLTKLRETLLPKLLSGEIQINNKEDE